MSRDIQNDLDDIPDVEIPDDVCKRCGGTGYILALRPGKHMCPECWQDNGPDEPPDRENDAHG